MTILVTGGAGFIGSNFVTGWIRSHGSPIINLDKLTYAGNLDNLKGVVGDKRHIFVRGDISDTSLVAELLRKHEPTAIVHLAAESHVDRSIVGPAPFISTNIQGTFCLLEATRQYWDTLPAQRQATFRFLHVSTDEVFGPLPCGAEQFVESSPYSPSSPYAASKAAADQLVNAYFRTYGLPILVARCCNNYGPFQHPEKLIPKMICNALSGQPLPIYGDGQQTRDWIFVDDNCRALVEVLEKGLPGESYNIAAGCELPNRTVVAMICAVLDRLRPKAGHPHRELVVYVGDRPGHDRRYAMSDRKLSQQIGWCAMQSFGAGLEKTVRWYLENYPTQQGRVHG